MLAASILHADGGALPLITPRLLLRWLMPMLDYDYATYASEGAVILQLVAHTIFRLAAGCCRYCMLKLASAIADASAYR